MHPLTFPQFNIVLFQPEIPANTGNIGRLCVGTEAHLHIIKPCRFLLDDKSLRRAGLDYWQDVYITLHDSLDAFLLQHPIDRIWFCTTKTDRSYWNQRYAPQTCFVFGPESRGLPESLLDSYPDRCITIPMSAAIRSVNLANSVAVILYEAIRQNLPR